MEPQTSTLEPFYCLCGCGRVTAIVNGRHNKYIRFHQGNPPKRNYLKWPRWKVNPDTQCWEWLLAKYPGGYGVMSRKGTSPTCAHRLIYEAYKGSIPEDMDLDHLCKNKGCVNPDHLEPVTRNENSQRYWNSVGRKRLWSNRKKAS